jgi:hypothetical protein
MLELTRVAPSQLEARPALRAGLRHTHTTLPVWFGDARPAGLGKCPQSGFFLPRFTLFGTVPCLFGTMPDRPFELAPAAAFRAKDRLKLDGDRRTSSPSPYPITVSQSWRGVQVPELTRIAGINLNK